MNTTSSVSQITNESLHVLHGYDLRKDLTARYTAENLACLELILDIILTSVSITRAELDVRLC